MIKIYVQNKSDQNLCSKQRVIPLELWPFFLSFLLELTHISAGSINDHYDRVIGGLALRWANGGCKGVIPPGSQAQGAIGLGNLLVARSWILLMYWAWAYVITVRVF